MSAFRIAGALVLGCAVLLGASMAVTVAVSSALYGYVGRHGPAWLYALAALVGAAAGTGVATLLLPPRRWALAAVPAALALSLYVSFADEPPGSWAWIASMLLGAGAALLWGRRRAVVLRAAAPRAGGAPAA